MITQSLGSFHPRNAARTYCKRVSILGLVISSIVLLDAFTTIDPITIAAKNGLASIGIALNVLALLMFLHAGWHLFRSVGLPTMSSARDGMSTNVYMAASVLEMILASVVCYWGVKFIAL